MTKSNVNSKSKVVGFFTDEQGRKRPITDYSKINGRSSTSKELEEKLGVILKRDGKLEDSLRLMMNNLRNNEEIQNKIQQVINTRQEKENSLRKSLPELKNKAEMLDKEIKQIELDLKKRWEERCCSIFQNIDGKNWSELIDKFSIKRLGNNVYFSLDENDTTIILDNKGKVVIEAETDPNDSNIASIDISKGLLSNLNSITERKTHILAELGKRAQELEALRTIENQRKEVKKQIYDLEFELKRLWNENVIAWDFYKEVFSNTKEVKDSMERFNPIYKQDIDPKTKMSYELMGGIEEGKLKSILFDNLVKSKINWTESSK